MSCLSLRPSHHHSLGSSAGGRDLPALVLGATPRVHRPGVPEVRLQAGLAGGAQLAATETLLHLAHTLATRYRHNSLVTQVQQPCSSPA